MNGLSLGKTVYVSSCKQLHLVTRLSGSRGWRLTVRSFGKNISGTNPLGQQIETDPYRVGKSLYDHRDQC